MSWSCCVSCVYFPGSITRGLPTIIDLYVNGNQITDRFVQVLDNSNAVKAINTIDCIATDFGTVEFQYSADGTDGSWGEIPSFLNHSSIKTKDGYRKLSISDGNFRSITDLKKWNGFYRCHVTAELDGTSYAAISAPIRAILPCMYMYILCVNVCFFWSIFLKSAAIGCCVCRPDHIDEWTMKLDPKANSTHFVERTPSKKLQLSQTLYITAFRNRCIFTVWNEDILGKLRNF